MPLGLDTARWINSILGDGENASGELIRLVVLNNASLQMIPTTAAAIRAELGVADPYRITAFVWIAPALSVTTGIV